AESLWAFIEPLLPPSRPSPKAVDRVPDRNVRAGFVFMMLSRLVGGGFPTVAASGHRSARRPDAETRSRCQRGVRSGPSDAGWLAATPATARPSSGAGPARWWTPRHSGRSVAGCLAAVGRLGGRGG